MTNLLFNTLGTDHQWLKMNIDQPIDQFLSVSELRTPVLFKESQIHPSYWNEQFFESVVIEHVAYAKKLFKLGVKQIGILAADDGLLHKILSPRFSSLSLKERSKPLLSIYSELKDLFDEVHVWLTIEELAPGGFDATDGVEVAKKLQALGLKHLVASGGTCDFPPLFYRRATQEKTESLIFTEPFLATALWVLNHTSLAVSAVSFIDDPLLAQSLGRQLGLTSVIERS